MATMLASYMYFRKDHRVVLIDADFPQHSIKKLRGREVQALAEDEETQRAFRQISGKDQVYPIASSRMTDVFTQPSPDVPSTYMKASLPQLNTDTVIIDTPGSVAIEGLGTILENVDFVVIPLEPEEMSLVSSTEFIGALTRMEAVQRGVTPIAFWNKVRERSHRELIDAQNEVFRSVGVHVLKNTIPYSVKLKRSDTRSTIFPVNFRSLDLNHFMEELYQTIHQQ